MEITKILEKVDHTLLSPQATWKEIKALCDEGIRYRVASVCIPPCFVERAKQYVGEAVAVCTVIGFPNGYATTQTKVFETQEAVREGADEIDMVINIGMVKEGDYDRVLGEIRAVRDVCRGKILKVIIETCLLTEEEKIRMCQIVSESGADYIKTSTGFSRHGATQEDVALLRKYVSDQVRVKAAGGIATIEDAEAFLALGADRLGTSRIVKLLQQTERRI